MKSAWPARVLVVGVVMGILAAVPEIPHDQTLRIDLGDSSKITTALTVRWATAADRKSETSVEDWTGEVTFRYEKNQAPRVVLQEARLTDGDYVVEIEVSTEGGRAVTDRVVALRGGATTIDVASLALASDTRSEDGGFQ